MSAIVSSIREEVTAAISKDALQLPTMPEIALKIREVAEDPDTRVQELAAVIGTDPGITAQLIKVSNSPLYRGRQDASTVHMAITRLGVAFSCNLATGIAMKQCFQATSNVIDRRMRSVWAHATEVAAISTVLARNFTRLKPDLAALGGLVHNIGVLPVLTWAEEHDRLVHDGITLDRVINELQGELGSMILRNWDFPPELLDVPMNCCDFSRESPATDYVDVIQVANLQRYAGTEHPFAALDWTRVSAFTRLGIDGSEHLAALDGLSEEVYSAIAMLE
jgi:HD-like signal output (HDOD) protein